MGIELKPEIKNALLGMNFVEQYEKLSREYSAERIGSNNRLIYCDMDEVIEIIEALGYAVSFDKQEKFFKIVEDVRRDMNFGFNISLDSGMVDFVWIVKRDGELRLGSPWSIYSRLLVDTEYRIKKPVFSNYEDLEKILKEAFKMYEEFKSILIC
ncbi:hypothetical protein [Listeria booriae]|uniref:Uncharacterized protein n=1 Tax=Listeria booriae TaxID=1552123 RepID=A0A7X1DKS2_9LIST|nr:hypothetical protein [Listeria booriae]MBC1492632.1 hypothetical protein [Listeria booriae]MBC2285991.1 hypothetical protein [Listeria booriae]MBC2294718.1 hypothetical protein [Listeria booriae]MBC2303854.1 hypothetical protein [Listeria booriae]MBC2311110.1 hypothetical protein [Listeria booriae]